MAASAEMVRRAIVDLRDQRGDGRVQFQSEKNCWLRSFGDDQSHCNLHRNFDLGFCPASMRPLADAARGASVTHSGCGRRSLLATAGHG